MKIGRGSTGPSRGMVALGLARLAPWIHECLTRDSPLGIPSQVRETAPVADRVTKASSACAARLR
jgi:hypothetical protein